MIKFIDEPISILTIWNALGKIDYLNNAFNYYTEGVIYV